MGVGSNPTAFKRDSAMGLFLYAERKVEWAEEAEAVEKGVEALEPEKVNLQFPRFRSAAGAVFRPPVYGF